MPPRHKIPEGGDICAIFVHAGAGFHSFGNERHHLSACNDAAKVGMTILKNGGDATDAVEMCIRVLEDREITNAGYGSNLNMNGHVECDATMVDHLGRSGAIGAASHIKNPISLARIILRESIKPLSLSRVPPNLLVGDGAADFAAENGLNIVPHDFLVSEMAHERYLKWKADLRAASEKERQAHPNAESGSEIGNTRSSQAGSSVGTTFDRSTTPAEPAPLSSIPTPTRPLAASAVDLPNESYPSDAGHTPHPTRFRNSHTCETDAGYDHDYYGQDEATDVDFEWKPTPKRPKISGSTDGSDNDSGAENANLAKDREDNIVDTVGAIAIDGWGNIAAGSSSGGIGMKHRGRCGPAALVGVGTAVVPKVERDPDRVSVATVVSGTGEHMATTAAAATAAERVYYSHRRENGTYVACTEDEALENMINNEFVGHPGVRHSPCPGALGILAVKKTKDGVYFYFAHNTDSFAIASMNSDEKKPVCVMSRNKGNGSVAQGGRLSRNRYARKNS